jgi:hypothetical protein
MYSSSYHLPPCTFQLTGSCTHHFTRSNTLHLSRAFLSSYQKIRYSTYSASFMTMRSSSCNTTYLLLSGDLVLIYLTRSCTCYRSGLYTLYLSRSCTPTPNNGLFTIKFLYSYADLITLRYLVLSLSYENDTLHVPSHCANTLSHTTTSCFHS